MRPITARDLMNPEVLTVRASLPIDQLADFLVENEISGAPVEDAGGNLIGVVSLVDVAAAYQGGEDEASAANDDEDRPHFYRQGWTGFDNVALTGTERARETPPLTAADVMTPALYTVGEDATVSEIASAMLDGHLHRLLVTGESSSSVVGIVTTSDLLGLLVEEPAR